jgi:hypothetical protein
MPRYFTSYPQITYKGKTIRDITRRSKIRDDLLRDPYIFLPYTVREGEKPETIAELYYGSVDDTWLVLYANNITDPYFQWPLSETEFNAFFINKYAEFSNRTGFDVLRWGRDQTRTDNIVYFFVAAENTGRIIRYSPETDPLPAGATPVRVYEYEAQQNENKREIILIDKVYRNQVVEEFKRSLRP